MPAVDQAYSSTISEKDIRRQLDRCVSRALIDAEYAGLLLADPTVILGERGCPAQEYLSLRSIQASSLPEFARQAHALFWTLELRDHQPCDQDLVEAEAPRQVAAAFV